MKHAVLAATFAGALALLPAAGRAAVTLNDVTPGDEYFFGNGALTYDLGSQGLAVFDLGSPALVQVTAAPGFATGTLTLGSDPIRGILIDTLFTPGRSVGTFAMLFEITEGVLGSHAIVTFAGGLDSGFLTEGVARVEGTLTVEAAGVSVIPLPAGIVLLLTGLGGLAALGRRRATA